MAQEEKTNEVNAGKEAANAKTVLKMVIGGIVVVLGVIAVIVWVQDLFTVIRGFIGLFLVMAGAIVIAIAKE
jgi:uncharacterized membrane protein HdeD (DUF308 family)